MIEGLSALHLLTILVIAAMWVLPLVLIILGIRWLVERNRPDPRAILAERLARGQITREEFDAGMRAFAAPPASTTWGPPEPPASGPSGPVPPR